MAGRFSSKLAQCFNADGLDQAVRRFALALSPAVFVLGSFAVVAVVAS